MYCFLIGCYYLLAILTKNILSAIYVSQTGFKGRTKVSFVDVVFLVCFVAFSIFYRYAIYHEPEYYEEI